jgi:hypothetical protein
MFNVLAIGGIWGVPRSGLIFTRTGEDTLALTQVMPWEEGMPIPREELLAQQDGDYREIKKYMELAGITVSVLT